MQTLARAVTALAAGAVTLSGAVRAQQVDTAFERWSRARAVPIETVEPSPGLSDLRPLKAIVGAARVVALGEPAHGAHEPLAFRNRLFQYLVQELGFTAIVLESGLSESRRIHQFVLGGEGTAAVVARENLSWGFGMFQENEQLLQWMRDYNADPSHRRRIHFYGMDLSLGGPTGSTPTPAPIEAALGYLVRVDAANAGRLKTTLEPFLGRLPGGPPLTAEEHGRLTTALTDLNAVLERGREAHIRASGEEDFTWAHRNAMAAIQGDRVFRVPLPETPGGEIAPGAWALVNARDSAMAENALWALAREGEGGRVLVFAHNAHVMNAPITGGIWDAFERPPRSTGQSLRVALGDALLILGTSSAGNGAGLPPGTADAGGVDAALARLGHPRFLVDLRTARGDRAADWLAQRRALRANFTTWLTVAPGTAFDALFFVDTLTAAHPAAPTSP